MVTVDGGRVDISRGDTATLTLTFQGSVPADGVIVLITLKKNSGDQRPIWEKRLTAAGGRATLALSSEDTNQPPGPYWWDARILDGEQVVTPLGPQLMNILEVVGDVG